MSTEYPTFVGFVQFDPVAKEANGQSITEFTINAVGFASGQESLRVSVWEDVGPVDIQRGDYVAVQGKYKPRQAGDKTYHNLDAQILFVSRPTAQRQPREAVRKTTTAKKAIF